MKKIFTLAAAAVIALGVSAQESTTLCSFDAQNGGEKVNITISGTTAEKSVKYDENKTALTVLQLANGYMTDGVYNENAINLNYDGGFKAGDVLTVKGYINNKDAAKRATAVVITLNDANEPTTLNKFEDFINGNLEAGEPTPQTFTLTEDCPNLKLVRDGNTGCNLMYITVVRPASSGETTSLETIISETENAPVEYFNIQGVRISEPTAGQIVIRRQGNKVTKFIAL